MEQERDHGSIVHRRERSVKSLVNTHGDGTVSANMTTVISILSFVVHAIGLIFEIVVGLSIAVLAYGAATKKLLIDAQCTDCKQSILGRAVLRRKKTIPFVRVAYIEAGTHTCKSITTVMPAIVEMVKAAKTLGLTLPASKDQIKAAHKKMLLKFHPDINKKAGSLKKMQAVNVARDLLMKS